ncbi:hypothetical protein [Calidithermus chliarophilus]|uniref:hypothetical protein n=1 Tax=Calidithermus chliarophilus TaxID=52023 RepID=UPI0003FC0707|nr:hypothetical protein [Calidithermus chliarophilus]
MATPNKTEAASLRSRVKRSAATKKDQILALYLSGVSEVEDLAMITGTRSSYVGTVLQQAGLLAGYYDLYTSTAHPMNVYSKYFANQLGFKDEATARRSVEQIDRLYRQFGLGQDRAGQHHAMLMALTMFNRARWTGKGREADVYRRWLLERLLEAGPLDEGETPADSDNLPEVLPALIP